jgi:hypothetical protein
MWVVALGFVVGAGACGSSKPANPTGGTGGAGGSVGSGSGGNAGTSQKLVILHTNDIHSYFMGASPEGDYTPATPNDDATVGGMARLVSAVTAAKAQAAAAGKPVLLLDAGDFMMGSLFELLALAQAPELQFMQGLGYDATTIGNHELDWTSAGLAGILQAAVGKGVTLPILASNMKFSATDAGDDQLKMLADAGVIRTKLVKTIGKLKVGFFGLIGADAVRATPQAAPLTFDPIAVAALAMVTDLRQNDKVDLVIALSHSGIDSAGKGGGFPPENKLFAAQGGQCIENFAFRQRSFVGRRRGADRRRADRLSPQDISHAEKTDRGDGGTVSRPIGMM